MSNKKAVIEDLEEVLEQGKDLADTLENEFDVYTQKVNSWTDAQSSTSWFSWLFFWFSWLFFWRSHQKTEPDIALKSDQSILKEFEEKMRSSLKKNRIWIECFQEKFTELSQQKSSKKLKKNMELNEKSGEKESNIDKKKKSLFTRIKPAKKQKVILQLYCQQEADLVPSIMTELAKQLRTRLSKDGIELTMQKCASARDINLDLPLMVICLHAFRLGPDVCSAIREIPCKTGPNVAVLIVHHKDVFALPSESSNQILIGKEYSQLKVIIDIGFMEGKGIYKCGMNKNAIKELAKFISDNIKP